MSLQEPICRWYAVEWIDTDKWLFQSNCGVNKEISRNEKLFKYIYKDGKNKCPNCGTRMTVGALQD